MKSSIRPAQMCPGIVLVLLVLFTQNTRLHGQLPPPRPDNGPFAPPITPVVPAEEAPKKIAPDAPPPGAMEVRFGDKSLLKVVLKDERIDFDTAYGKLQIPVSDIQKIDIALRISAEDRKKIDAALIDLADEMRREAATATLLALKEKAYQTLALQAKDKDTQTAQRAEKVLEKLRAMVPVEMLEASTFDVVHTTHSKIAGRFKTDTLRVKTFAFGDQQMKLADVRELRSQSLSSTESLRTSFGPVTYPPPGVIVPLPPPPFPLQPPLPLPQLVR